MFNFTKLDLISYLITKHVNISEKTRQCGDANETQPSLNDCVMLISLLKKEELSPLLLQVRRGGKRCNLWRFSLAFVGSSGWIESSIEATADLSANSNCLLLYSTLVDFKCWVFTACYYTISSHVSHVCFWFAWFAPMNAVHTFLKHSSGLISMEDSGVFNLSLRTEASSASLRN